MSYESVKKSASGKISPKEWSDNGLDSMRTSGENKGKASMKKAGGKSKCD